MKKERKQYKCLMCSNVYFDRRYRSQTIKTETMGEQEVYICEKCRVYDRLGRK